jgi:hypothetical protein
MTRALLLGLALWSACSSTTAAPDLRAADLALAERGPDAPRSDARRDLAPDGPKPPARWTTSPSSLKLRGHTATLLQSGELLVAGGYTDEQTGNTTYLRKSYRYLPASDTLVDAGELAAPRGDHVAVRLLDGRVLVLGGSDASVYPATTEVFDPTKPAAAAWSTGAALPEGRFGASAILLEDGRVMVTGGDADGSDSLEVILFLQPAATAWTIAMTPLKERRRHHVTTLLPDGKVLLSGGSRGSANNPVYLKSLEVYDPKTGTSRIAGTMTRARTFHSATLLDDGRVLLAGGYCGGCSEAFDDLFDPKTDTVTPILHPGDYPWSHVAVKLLDGRVLIVAHDTASGLAVAFDAAASPPAWDTLPALPHPRVSARGARLADGSVVVVGGISSQSPFTYAAEIDRLFP